ncbi:MAG: hypothetical protein QM831_35040 [Kofleriaceae bacterium]
MAVRADAGPTPPAPAASAPTIVALAAGDRDARESVAIGPNGEAYVGDGKGAWVRTRAGGIAGDVARATRAGTGGPNGAGAVVGIDGGPPYRLDKAGTWQMVVLGLHAKAVLGRGPRATAAFGKHVFDLEKPEPGKLADAPGNVAMLGAGASGVVAQTDKGLVKLATKGAPKWKPIAKAPPPVIAIVDDRWALVDRGMWNLDAGTLVAWPQGFRVATVSSLGDSIIAAGSIGANAELVTISGKASTLAHAPIGVKLAAPIVSITGDKVGRVVIVARDGSLAVRDKANAWTAANVSDQLPADKPGSPPAESQ